MNFDHLPQMSAKMRRTVAKKIEKEALEAQGHGDEAGDGDDTKRKGMKRYGSDKKRKNKDPVKLQITIKNATNLRDADIVGHSDPFCVMEIPGRKTKPKVHETTEVIDETCNPTWNHKFTCNCAVGDPLLFSVYDKDMMSDEFLGRCTLLPKMYFPFGFNGEMRLEDTGEDTYAHLYVAVKILEMPEEDHDDDAVPDDEKDRGNAGLFAGIDPLAPTANIQRAEIVMNVMEEDMCLQREDTTSTALETLVRLAESGLIIPKQAIERVVACLHGPDRRYRLSALAICKAMGSERCKPFAVDFAKALNDNDADVRMGACKILGQFGEHSSPFVEQMGNLLQDEVPAVRSAALEALGVLSQADNVDALIVLGSCLKHKEYKYRLATCLILKALGIKATPHADLLIERIEMDPYPDVRVAACSTLGCLGAGANSVQEAIGWLYYYEHDYDRRVARAATDSLKKLKSEGRHLPNRPKTGIGSEPPRSKHHSHHSHHAPAEKSKSAKTSTAPKTKEVSKTSTKLKRPPSSAAKS